MTYRDILLQADPHVVHEAIGTHEVEFRGRKLRLTTEEAFDICKGLKYYAQGMRLDVPEEEEAQKIFNDDKPQFKWTRKHRFSWRQEEAGSGLPVRFSASIRHIILMGW